MLMDYILRSRDLIKDSHSWCEAFSKGKFPLLPSFIKGEEEIKEDF